MVNVCVDLVYIFEKLSQSRHFWNISSAQQTSTLWVVTRCFSLNPFYRLALYDYQQLVDMPKTCPLHAWRMWCKCTCNRFSKGYNRKNCTSIQDSQLHLHIWSMYHSGFNDFLPRAGTKYRRFFLVIFPHLHLDLKKHTSRYCTGRKRKGNAHARMINKIIYAITTKFWQRARTHACGRRNKEK